VPAARASDARLKSVQHVQGVILKKHHSLALAATLAVIGIASGVSADESALQGIEATAGAPAAKLYVEQNGVALSQFPSRSRLSESVLIGVTGNGAAVTWTSTSNAAWLTATPSGTTGQPITLTADPGTLAPNKTHVAAVKVSTSQLGSTEVSATIRVSLWISATDPGIVTISQDAAALAANPVEPWVYVSTSGTAIEVFNVYTGLPVATFPLVAPTVGQLAVSSNGRELFAVDTTNYRIIQLDASTGREIAAFPLVGPIAADFSFAYGRPAGVETLFAPGQSAINIATGKKVSAPINITNGFYDPLISVTPSGSKIAIVERGLSPGSLYTYAVSGPGGRLTVTAEKSASINGENCQALAMSHDGSRLYPACGYPYEFDVYDANTLLQVQTLAATHYPDNAIIDSNGDFVGGLNGLYDVDDVYVFDTAGFLLGAVPTTTASYSEGQGSNLLVTSGDSTRVISATGAVYNADQTLMFRPLP
jgi:hypothetical protein